MLNRLTSKFLACSSSVQSHGFVLSVVISTYYTYKTDLATAIYSTSHSISLVNNVQMQPAAGKALRVPFSPLP